MNKIYLLLGSNEGDRFSWLEQCMRQIEANIGIITQRSSVYETAAWGLEEQPDFLNMAIEVQTALQPSNLLEATRQIEHNLGRQRTLKWGQRTLDIDILFYNTEVIDQPELTIPHPYLQDRRFALVPLYEIAANMVHPVLNKSIETLLNECPDPLPVKEFSLKTR